MPVTQKERIAFKNLDETVRLLRKVGVPSAELRKAGIEAAKVLAEYAKQEAPVSSTKYKSGGALRASVKPGATQKTGYVKVGSTKRVPYAGPILFGWFYDKEYFIQKNIKPNQFVFRALGKHRPEIVDLYRRELDELIRKNTPPRIGR